MYYQKVKKPGSRIDDSVELIVGDSFRIEIAENRLPLQVLVSLEQGLPHLGLAGSSIAN